MEILFIFHTLGFASIVELLLQTGATTAITNDLGELYMCTKYEGIKVTIETYRQDNVKRVMELIHNKKGLSELKKKWLVRVVCILPILVNLVNTCISLCVDSASVRVSLRLSLPTIKIAKHYLIF